MQKPLQITHSKNLTVEVTWTSWLGQTELMFQDIDQQELTKAYFCVTPLIQVIFEWQYFLV